MQFSVLESSGLHEDTFLSFRCGSQQWHGRAVGSSALRLPKRPWPLRVDALARRAKNVPGAVLFTSPKGLCKVPLVGSDGRNMSVTFKVTDELQEAAEPSAASSPAKKLTDADREAKVQSYLDRHQVHQFLTAVFEHLLSQKPADPYAFLADCLRKAADVVDKPHIYQEAGTVERLTGSALLSQVLKASAKPPERLPAATAKGPVVLETVLEVAEESTASQLPTPKGASLDEELAIAVDGRQVDMRGESMEARGLAHFSSASPAVQSSIPQSNHILVSSEVTLASPWQSKPPSIPPEEPPPSEPRHHQALAEVVPPHSTAPQEDHQQQLTQEQQPQEEQQQQQQQQQQHEQIPEQRQQIPEQQLPRLPQQQSGQTQQQEHQAPPRPQLSQQPPQVQQHQHRLPQQFAQLEQQPLRTLQPQPKQQLHSSQAEQFQELVLQQPQQLQQPAVNNGPQAAATMVTLESDNEENLAHLIPHAHHNQELADDPHDALSHLIPEGLQSATAVNTVIGGVNDDLDLGHLVPLHMVHLPSYTSPTGMEWHHTGDLGHLVPVVTQPLASERGRLSFGTQGSASARPLEAAGHLLEHHQQWLPDRRNVAISSEHHATPRLSHLMPEPKVR